MIDSFKMLVTSEQCNIVQDIIFKNGYCWVGYNKPNMKQFNNDDICLYFKESSTDDDGGVGLSYSSASQISYFAKSLPVIKFYDFYNEYVKEERKKKLEKIIKSTIKK